MYGWKSLSVFFRAQWFMSLGIEGVKELLDLGGDQSSLNASILRM